MIRVRFLRNTILFVDSPAKPQRQWHITRGDIHAVDKVNAVSDRQYQFVLPNGVVNGVDKDTVEVIRDVPQAKSSQPGCGGCGH